MYRSINHYTCFPFENFLGSIKRRIRSRKHVLQQVYNRLHEKSCSANQKSNFSNILSKKEKYLLKYKYDHIYEYDKLVSFKCKRIIFDSFFLTIKKPDNCVILKSNKICLIQFINFSNEELFFEAIFFAYRYDLYEYPIKSSKLNIFFCKGLREASAENFYLDDIVAKGLLLPFKEGFAFFLLNHTKQSLIS